MKKTLTLFLISIKRSRQKERTKDDDHERRATEDGRMEGVGKDRLGEEGNAR